MSVCECIHVCSVCAEAHGGPGFPGLEFIGSRDPLCMSFWKSDSGLSHLSLAPKTIFGSPSFIRGYERLALLNKIQVTPQRFSVAGRSTYPVPSSLCGREAGREKRLKWSESRLLSLCPTSRAFQSAWRPCCMDVSL